MIRKFHIKINEKEYDVELEEIGGVPQIQPAPVNNVSTESAAPAPAASAQPVSADGETITSPMPGNIISVSVAVGDHVEENQVLLVLEAMKMENEIVSPKAGTITGVHIRKGDVVDVSAPLITLT